MRYTVFLLILVIVSLFINTLLVKIGIDFNVIM